MQSTLSAALSLASTNAATSLHIPGICSCPACCVATTPTGAANIAAWDGFVATSTDPFTPTATETAAALAEDGDDLFDLLAFSPFADETPSHAIRGEWPCCPWHGDHEADDDGDCLPYCTRCERRL